MDILSDRKPRPRSTQLLLSLWQIIGIFTCLITLVGISDIFQTQTLLAQKNLQMIQLLGVTNVKKLSSSPMPAAFGNQLPTCDFHMGDIDPACPRFVNIRFRWLERAGLGDRFFQLLVGLTYALHLNAFLVNVDSEMSTNSTHGPYDWVPNFFKINYVNSNITMDAIKDRYSNLTVVKQVEEYGRSYEERIQALGSHCNTVIQIDNDDCDGGPECYFSHNPKIYEHMHNIMACWFLHTDRSNLPALIFDSGWYNVAIHLRVGDVVLFDGDRGKDFFTKLKSQLDKVLIFSPVHYFFFVEAPYDELVNEPAVPPTGFAFLADIFEDRSHGNEGTFSQRKSYIKHMGVKESLYHYMNADMVIATGSSFPLVAVTVSSKPVVLFTKSKEGGFYPSQMRGDYAMIGDDGAITSPTIAELSAQALMRFLEVHEKRVPYE